METSNTSSFHQNTESYIKHKLNKMPSFMTTIDNSTTTMIKQLSCDDGTNIHIFIRLENTQTKRFCFKKCCLSIKHTLFFHFRLGTITPEPFIYISKTRLLQ